jgi:GDP-L-fucose synthase
MLNGRVFVAGHTGLVGSACLRAWASRPGVTLLTAPRAELDLTDAEAVRGWMRRQRPNVVIVAAGKVGGIQANAQQPADFIHQNLMIQATVIDAAWRAGAARLINFGSACMYPKACRQPMRVEDLLTGPMEPTSQPYAIAKLAGVTLCEAYNRQHGTRFIAAIPCTLFGPGDNFDPLEAHVLGALIRKLHEGAEAGAAEVTLWGSGAPRREFLYVDDLVAACERLLAQERVAGPVNIGAGESVPIRELAELIRDVTGFQGRIAWDASRPDGAPDKCLDSSWLRGLGWAPRVGLREGIARTHRWFLDHCLKDAACTSS